MSDEPEARMWDDDEVVRFESRAPGAFLGSSFLSQEHLDRTPLLLEEESFAEVPVDVADAEDHCHWKAKSEPPSAVRQLIVALVLCGIFMICEVFGGYLAGSLSIMSDAAHMLSDCGGFALALLAFRCASRPATSTMSYGYRRAEVLGAMVSVLLIWLLTGIFVFVACQRLYADDYDIDPNTMMIVSGCGVVFNVVLALVLHGCGSSIAHHHSHGGAPCQQANSHSHAHAQHKPPLMLRLFRRKQLKQNGIVNGDYSLRDLQIDEDTRTKVVDGADRNINLRAALIHVIGDLIQSCGVLLASVIIKLYPSAKWVDPVCTFLFSILVLITSAQVVRDALNMLMQGVPKNFKYAELVSSLSRIQGVRHVHSVHVWWLSTAHIVLTAHLAIDELADPEPVLKASQKLSRDTFKVQSATFQIERYTELNNRCDDCSQPCAPL